VLFLLLICKYYAKYVLRSLFFEINVTDKRRKLSHDQTMGATWLQYFFKAAFFHFKADGMAPHGILSNTPAIMASSLVHVRRVRGRPAVKSAVDVALHGGTAAIFETHYRLNGVDQDNVSPLPVQRCQLDYYRYRGLT
jgi:hypothetical protein